MNIMLLYLNMLDISYKKDIEKNFVNIVEYQLFLQYIMLSLQHNLSISTQYAYTVH